MTQDAVTIPFLQKDAATKQSNRNSEGKTYLAYWTKLPKFVDSKQGDTKYNENNAQLVEPIRAQNFFEREHGLHPLLGGWAWTRRSRHRRTWWGSMICSHLGRCGDASGWLLRHVDRWRRQLERRASLQAAFPSAEGMVVWPRRAGPQIPFCEERRVRALAASPEKRLEAQLGGREPVSDPLFVRLLKQAE